MEEGFHAKDGWYFKRLEDGSVEMRRETSKYIENRVTFDPDTWASIVAAVSQTGETSSSFRVAEAVHGARVPGATRMPGDPAPKCRGFVPKSGFGNGATCACGSDLASHKVVAQ